MENGNIIKRKEFQKQVKIAHSMWSKHFEKLPQKQRHHNCLQTTKCNTLSTNCQKPKNTTYKISSVHNIRSSSNHSFSTHWQLLTRRIQYQHHSHRLEVFNAAYSDSHTNKHCAEVDELLITPRVLQTGAGLKTKGRKKWKAFFQKCDWQLRCKTARLPYTYSKRK